MLCGVTATLGSNPSATATAARPHWGRAVLLCLRGVLYCRALRGRVACGPTGVPGAVWCVGGPGCFMCPWAAVFLLVVCCPDRSPAAAWPARPLAVRAASFARRVVSKPGQAPQASRRPPIGRGVCVLSVQVLPPPTGTAAGSSGALHPSGAWCAGVWLGVAPRSSTMSANQQFRMQFP